MTNASQTDTEEVARELFGHLGGFMTALSMHHGLRLGLYEALLDDLGTTSEELAHRTGLSERWVREWLYQQTAARMLLHVDGERFTLRPGLTQLLAPGSPIAATLDGLPLYLDGFAHLPEAMRTGRGRDYDAFGDEVWRGAESVAAMSREPLLDRALPALGGVHEALRAGGRAADIGCGAGLLLIAMAEAYPASAWQGYDVSEQGLRWSREALAASAANNVSFANPLKEPLPSDHSLDLVTFIDVLHDATFPGELLTAAHAALKPEGVALVVEVGQPDELTEKLADPLAPFIYGVSMSICLSSSLSEEGGEGIGTFGLSRSVLERLALEAGFTRVDIVDVGENVNAYYALRP
jgi:ubiquinone/menaquinone biosynthesis C-methylase UbiE